MSEPVTTVNVWLVELPGDSTERLDTHGNVVGGPVAPLWLDWIKTPGERGGISWVKNPWLATWFVTLDEANAALDEMAAAARDLYFAVQHSFDLGAPSALYAATGGGEPFIRAMRLAGHIVDLPDAIAAEEARRNERPPVPDQH